jgi:WD40 repeat protein
LPTAILPDGERLAVVRDGVLEIFNLASGSSDPESVHPTANLGTCFTPGGRYMFGMRGAKIRMWDLKGNREIGGGDEFESEFGVLAFSPDGKYIAAAGAGDKGRLELWNADELTPVTEFSHRLADTLNAMDGTRDQRVVISSLNFSSDGKQLAAAADSDVLLCSVPEAKLTQRIRSRGASLARFLPDGIHLAIGRWSDSDVELREIETGKVARLLVEHWEGVPWIDASLLSSLVATGSADRTVALWDLRDWAVRHRLEGPKDRITGVAVSDDGAVVVASAETSFHAWNAQDGKLLWRRDLPHYWRRPIALSPNGKIVAIAGGFRAVDAQRTPELILVDANSGRDLKVIDGMETVNSVVFSPDSRRMAVATASGTFSLWNVDDVLQGTKKETQQ